ncbi:hypothetical protein CLAFUW4_01676 [Fulvia fulva]|uniref:F-box domain-containing protein n=1 Tax=Passalora fulva TaxID=5499 RepID=A0A9Q8L889_PASFU|nr:uncharacterized protein CLAFUR5_01675 [Fulvia fulva]KAK4634405.1 hypothetical protein CLAFUR4_01674 [Fulvia fulva]KAK4638552.1 hypothetical protein CLAFUR0_01675 [Fulvia fulva]UJO12649.1 hypothetical protein CLAFUR5_01675 [Fulvia fulva]WPV09283.1 hypothetical protein CLAFUW4_01676 [Fulvia fulva]WPV25105.1 hypothetical protein CLAFUW7_01678 [Fulvia fulva]
MTVTSCSLLALPAELRLRIYEYVLAPTQTLHLTSSATHRRAVSPRVSPQLLATCQQIHGEAHEVLYGDNSVCIVVDGQAMGAPAVAESRLPQSVLDRLQHVCLVVDCTALFRAHFVEVDFDTLGALIGLERARIAMVIRTGTEDDTPSADMRDALGSLIALILQRVPATASVEYGVEAGSAEADVAERVRVMRQQSFRKEQRIVIINVDGSELKEKAVKAVAQEEIEQGSKSGLVADVYAEYRRRR